MMSMNKLYLHYVIVKVCVITSNLKGISNLTLKKKAPNVKGKTRKIKERSNQFKEILYNFDPEKVKRKIRQQMDWNFLLPHSMKS